MFQQRNSPLFYICALLFLGIVLIVQLKSQRYGLIVGDFLLIGLIVASFFFDFLQLFFVIILFGFAIQWQPVVGKEIVLFTFLPILAWWLRSIIQWRPWALAILFSILTPIIFYLITDIVAIANNPETFSIIVFIDAMFGALSFFMIQSLYGVSQKEN